MSFFSEKQQSFLASRTRETNEFEDDFDIGFQDARVHDIQLPENTTAATVPPVLRAATVAGPLVKAANKSVAVSSAAPRADASQLFRRRISTKPALKPMPLPKPAPRPVPKPAPKTTLNAMPAVAEPILYQSRSDPPPVENETEVQHQQLVEPPHEDPILTDKADEATFPPIGQVDDDIPEEEVTLREDSIILPLEKLTTAHLKIKTTLAAVSFKSACIATRLVENDLNTIIDFGPRVEAVRNKMEQMRAMDEKMRSLVDTAAADTMPCLSFEV